MSRHGQYGCGECGNESSAQERKGCPDRHVALPDVAHGADVAAPRWLWASAPTVGAHGECGNSRPISARSVQYAGRSEEHTSELQSLMRSSYAVFCLKKKNKN